MSRTPTGTEQDGPPRRRPSVQAIDRAADVLRCFDARTPQLGVSDIARRTGLSTSTVYRILLALVENRFVRQTPDRRYALGSLVIQLARSGAAITGLRELARPVMVHLRDLSEETCALHELVGTRERMVVDQVESHHELRRTYSELGVPLALPHGAPGKVILAHLAFEIQAEVLAAPLDPVTSASITDAANLADQLAAIRNRGYSVSVGERTPGIGTAAAPIFDATERVVGCVSVSGPEGRMPLERLEALGQELVAAAWSISEQLGASEDGIAACLSRAGDPADAERSLDPPKLRVVTSDGAGA